MLEGIAGLLDGRLVVDPVPPRGRCPAIVARWVKIISTHLSG